MFLKVLEEYIKKLLNKKYKHQIQEKENMRKYVLLTSILLLAVLASVSIANATPSPHYTYTVTNNYHGIDTPLGATVVVTATTDDPDVVNVVFLWKDATATEQWRETVAVVFDGTNYVAQSTGSPDSLGDWGVQALFVGSDGQTIQEVENVVAIKATSFNVVPEVPILGTAGIAGAMALGWVVKAKRKNDAL